MTLGKSTLEFVPATPITMTSSLPIQSVHAFPLESGAASAGLTIDLAAPSPLPGGRRILAKAAGDGFTYHVTPGWIAKVRWLTCDLISDHTTDLALNLEFHEPGSNRPFLCRFTLLPMTQARLRFNLEALAFNRWRYGREGGCLKPTIGGWRVDPARVDRLVLRVLYKAPGPAHWWMTPLESRVTEPPLLESPVLLQKPLLDPLGQATFRQWPGRTSSAEELTGRLRAQLESAPAEKLPAPWTAWGGWRERRVEATDFFRTHHDGARWWLVDPDGHYFWSAGIDCVTPNVQTTTQYLREALAWLPDETGEYADCFALEASADPSAPGERQFFDYLKANLIRAFGPAWYARWQTLAFAALRKFGFNTCGNWSDTEAARIARVPYAYPIPPLASADQKVPRIFRDFPDVFDPAFEEEAALFAAPLRKLANDPAMLGYFLMNEPMWGFARMLVAEGVLRNAPACATRRAFRDWLGERYADDAALAAAWGIPVTLGEIAEGPWTRAFPEAALGDLRSFSTILVRKLYDTLSAACRKVAPHHLNLGARFASAPEEWIIDAMGAFDVFSINCYQTQADEKLGPVCERLGVPAIIGEWHFGAIDAGLPAPGIGHAADQAGRGQAYRYFVEQSAARPWCVGAHWFTLYDQSALGRADGENYNIGFLDVCHRPYDALASAARETHERLYAVAAGSETPFDQPPVIAERLNM